MIKQFLIIQLLLGVCYGYCDWAPDKPKIHQSLLSGLQKSKVICHNHIMVLFNNDIGFPFASYAVHTQEQMSKLQGGRKDFIPDPSIPLSQQHLPNDTIFHLPYSRGHLTPSFIMTYDKSPNGAWEETYYMSNILPQTAYLNEGGWEKLEMNIVNALQQQPSGTTWEIYTGGFWNGQEELGANLKEIKTDYLFWKAICNRKKCSSGLITAYNHDGVLRWNVLPVAKLLPGLFDECCPWNKALSEWVSLLINVNEHSGRVIN